MNHNIASQDREQYSLSLMKCDKNLSASHADCTKVKNYVIFFTY